MPRILRWTLPAVLAACVSTPDGTVRPDAPGVSGEDVASDVPVHTPAPELGEPDGLRRLSTRELRHAISDLYGLDADAGLLPPEGDALGFDNDRRSQFSTAGLVDGHVELMKLVAERVVETRPDLFGCDVQTAEGDALTSCLQDFVRSEGRRLFRRSITDTDVDAFTGLLAALPEDATSAERARLLLQGMLLAPDFHLFDERAADPTDDGPTRVDGFTLATRLSAFLWESVPDDALLDAAASGELDTADGVRTQVGRMMEDPRFRRTQARFLHAWLDLDRLDGRSKSTEDNLDEALRAAAEHEVQAFVDEILLPDDTPFLDVLTSTRAIVNPRLAELYGVDAPEGWGEVSVPERPGLLGRFAFLAGHGHPDRPSPVLRGVTINTRLLCVNFPPPPANAEAAAAAVADEVDIDTLTNREMYELTTMQGTCGDCHTRINPVGYALEGFDTMGRIRSSEPNGRELDTVSEIEALGATVNDGAELMQALAASPTVHECASRHWLRFASGGGQLENDDAFRQQLASELGAGLAFGKVAERIATDDAFARMIPEGT